MPKVEQTKYPPGIYLEIYHANGGTESAKLAAATIGQTIDTGFQPEIPR